MATDIHLLDYVELVEPFGKWPAGTAGTVVDEFPGGVAVELVGPAGETLDLFELPVTAVRLVESPLPGRVMAAGL